MSNQGKEKAVVAWKDNGAVIMASNCFGSEPIRKAERWDRKEKKEVFQICPMFSTSIILQWEVLTVKIKTQITGYQCVPESGVGLCFHEEQMSQYKMLGCCLVQVIQVGVCLSLDGTLPDVCLK